MHYSKSENVDFQALDDQLIVLDLSGNAYYSLNGTARFFVEKAVQGLSFDEILSDAMREFEADVSRMRADFQALSEDLVKLGMLVVRNDE